MQSLSQYGRSRPVVCFGELLIDFVATENGVSLAEATTFAKAPGGAPANVAAGLAKFGLPSAFVGKVGDDEFGRMLAHLLAAVGVNVSGVRFDETARTALAFVSLKENGERDFMFYRHPSADMLLRPEELDRQLVANASIFHFGSIPLITSPADAAQRAAMQMAKEGGALLSYDPNLRLPLWPSAAAARAGIFSIWKEAHLIKISDEELRFLVGKDSDEAAQSVLRPNHKLLLVTEGGAGCRYYTADFHGRVPGFSVDAIDTTGAGDAFVAGFLSQLCEDAALWEDETRLRAALRFANAAGALTTTQRGAIPALPSLSAVESLVKPSVG